MPRYTVEYKSHNNVVYSCKYHGIWCPKHRRPVLVPEVAERPKPIIRAVAEEYGAEVAELEVMPDHVHLLVEVDRQFGVHQLVRKSKGRSSRLLRDETKLSQACHGCGTIEKEPLALRVHACECGVFMQRDLYSAFLARCVGEDNLLHAGLARMRWPGAEPLLRAAWSEATQPANGRLGPSSFGVLPWSRSGSPAEEGIAKAEAPDALAEAQVSGESRGEAAVVPLSTPRL